MLNARRIVQERDGDWQKQRVQPQDYLLLGWQLVPIWSFYYGRCGCGDVACANPGKHPNGLLARSGFKSASADPSVISDWQRAYPDSNWAVATGPVSGILVFDIDGPEGEAALADLERQNGYLSDATPMQWTGGGRGGWQAFYAYPTDRVIRNSIAKLGPKIDVRSAGAGAIIPPSVTRQPYSWAPERDPWTMTPPCLPEAWINLLDPPQPANEPFQTVPDVGNARGGRYALKALEAELALVAIAPPGRRNGQLNASAFSLLRFVATGELDANIVCSGLQAAASHAGLQLHEISSTIESAAKARRVNLG